MMRPDGSITRGLSRGVLRLRAFRDLLLTTVAANLMLAPAVFGVAPVGPRAQVLPEEAVESTGPSTLLAMSRVRPIHVLFGCSSNQAASYSRSARLTQDRFTVAQRGDGEHVLVAIATNGLGYHLTS